MLPRFLLLAAALLPGCFSAAGSLPASPCRPLENSVSASLIPAGAILERGLSPSTRANLLCDLREAMAEKYVFWNWKERILGTSSSRLVEACASRELTITDPSLLHFEDRVRECMAGFHDGHLIARPQIDRPQVFAGLEIGVIEGKAVVTSISRVLKKQWEARQPDLAQSLVPGTEISLIDGVSLQTQVQKLGAFVSASTEAARMAIALKAITRRDFVYPDAGVLRLTLAASGKTLEVPWWSMGINQREDARNLFRSLGIRALAELGMEAERSIADGKDATGAGAGIPLPTEEPAAEFYADSGRLGLRAGKVRSGTKSACYLQLLTFESNRWKPTPFGASSVPFALPISAFSARCEQEGLPTILDLRLNPGGDPELARALVAAYLPPSTRVGGILFSARVSRHVEQVLERYELGDGFPLPPDPASPVRLRLEALRRARASGSEFLPWVMQEDIIPSPGAGNSRQLVVLTSPLCASTCEIAARLFEENRRGSVWGEPSAGTGGRFLEIGANPTAGWRDDRFGTVNVSIPNSVFGISPRTLGGEFFLDFASNSSLLRENESLAPGRALGLSPLSPSSQGQDLVDGILSGI